MNERTNFFEFLGQNAIKYRDLFILNIVLLPIGIADQVGKQFEEASLLIVDIWALALNPIEDLEYGLNCVFKVATTTMNRNRLIRDYDELRVGF